MKSKETISLKENGDSRGVLAEEIGEEMKKSTDKRPTWEKSVTLQHHTISYVRYEMD